MKKYIIIKPYQEKHPAWLSINKKAHPMNQDELLLFYKIILVS